MVKRFIENDIIHALDNNKIVILYGARQTGKTTLATEIAKKVGKTLYLNCDEMRNVERLKPNSSDELKQLTNGYDALFLDEAQRVPNIGLVLKIFHDLIPEIKVLATGSSSFDLANKIKEPLTGRSKEFVLYPFSVAELDVSRIESENTLDNAILYGSYPATLDMSINERMNYLRELADNYLYKDVFTQDTVFDPSLLRQLVKLLAYQVGSETSYTKIANNLGSNKNTITRYVDLLEKAFIVFRMYQYRNNQSREIGKLRKVYFYDTGVRNGIIDDFNQLTVRPDSGGLWENYCLIERRKSLQAKNIYSRNFYWRSTRGQEIDLIEEKNNKLKAYEFKLGNSSRQKLHPQFINDYGNVDYEVINSKNFYDFVT